jgi:4-amino-4-deoxy-L-arabinose transferase-like glycosyltransferase
VPRTRREIPRLAAVRPPRAILLVAAAAALPRLVVLGVERGGILEDFVEKSNAFAHTFVASGTFGFVPGVPSGYTQPLYAFFLAALYWPLGDSWLVVGLAQTIVAVATALLVLAIGRRLHSLELGVAAALVTTVHPYLVWHDVHVNREILDGFLLALITLLALLAYDRRSVPLAALTGGVTGLAILGNSRLALLPVVLAPYLVWKVRPRLDAVVGGGLAVVFAVIVIVPWMVRNDSELGCFALTTDTRALWKANNENTYDVLASGKWIDDVPDLPGVPPWPEQAARISPAAANAVDECAQMRFYRDKVLDFWRDEPLEKARLAVQAVGMLWRPTFTTETAETAGGGGATFGRRVVEPAFMLTVFALAIWGLFLAPGRFVVLALLLEAYNTLAAMAFAGTVRYRVPYDFLLAMLAAFALLRLADAARDRVYERRRPSAAP